MVYTIANTTVAPVGTYSPEKDFSIYSVKKTTQANTFSKGDIVGVDATNGGYKAAAAGAVKPVAVVMTDSTATDNTVSVLHHGEVVVKANGAIKFGKEVMCAGTNAVKVWDGTSRDAAVGVYNGHPGEGDEAYPQTDAADTDLIKVIWMERS